MYNDKRTEPTVLAVKRGVVTGRLLELDLDDLALNRWHFAYGLHSNIPLCCVVEFITGTRDPLPEYLQGIDYRPCRACSERIRAGESPATVHECVDPDDPLCRLFVKFYDFVQYEGACYAE